MLSLMVCLFQGDIHIYIYVYVNIHIYLYTHTLYIAQTLGHYGLGTAQGEMGCIF